MLSSCLLLPEGDIRCVVRSTDEDYIICSIGVASQGAGGIFISNLQVLSACVTRRCAVVDTRFTRNLYTQMQAALVGIAPVANAGARHNQPASPKAVSFLVAVPAKWHFYTPFTRD